jgi:hypothetical protein
VAALQADTERPGPRANVAKPAISAYERGHRERSPVGAEKSSGPYSPAFLPDSVMVLAGALELALGVLLVDQGAVQAAVRYSLMSPAQVG